MDIFSKVSTKPKALEFHFSKDTKQKIEGLDASHLWEVGGGGEGQERIQNGIPHLTMRLYKMKAVDLLWIIVFRVRKHWDYCSHVQEQ